MKMHLFVSCLAVLSVMLHCVLAASAVNVGLYAPDRYNGIPETCLMPMDFGYCRAKVKRYYFDMRRMKCAMFYFGGCAGNVNNFKSLEECNRVCLDGYGDYDSPNDVVAVGNKVSGGRDYRSRGSVANNNNNVINTSSSRGAVNHNNHSGGSNIKNNTSATSFGGSTGSYGDTSYKTTYSKYNNNNNNYNTNTASSSSLTNVNNSGSGASGTGVGANNNTKILRNRSDDNLEEYDYEEEN